MDDADNEAALADNVANHNPTAPIASVTAAMSWMGRAFIFPPCTISSAGRLLKRAGERLRAACLYTLECLGCQARERSRIDDMARHL